MTTFFTRLNYIGSAAGPAASIVIVPGPAVRGALEGNGFTVFA